MPRPRVYKDEAIVLRQRRLGEADKIVTLLCAHHGKVDAVAKGVRRTKSRLGGHLEPLTLGAYLLAEGRELDIVTQAETVDGFPAVRADLDRLSRALYCAELVERLAPERSECNPVFRLLQATLERLGQTEAIDMAVRFFEMRLLSEMGYRPQLERCCSCGRPLEPVENLWSSLAGGALGPDCGRDAGQLRPLSLNGLKVLRLLQKSPFGECSRLRLSGHLAAEIEGCLRDHIHVVLDRDVRSAEFVERLRRESRPMESAAPASDV